jgi:4-hydroxy-3-polyprenylbenzoate decarboxylase|uniref:Flavin prenyltransferase UbiX n=1 Tax=Desulfobacca acetoxidans TaxID=60893 RepID=A0A7V6A6S1_9BACT
MTKLPQSPGKHRLVVAVTGASGMLYARELCAFLATCPEVEVHAVASEAGEQVLRLELGQDLSELAGPNAIVHGAKNFAAPLASGSFMARGMVVIPCTMGTLGAIAQGQSRNLIHRTAEVMLKEKRPLILVVRETPLSLVHLRNMVAAAEAGATIFPAMPGFYHRPRDLTEMARNFVGRILDHLSLKHDLSKRWGEEGTNL